jgi:hypothetical protein
MPSVDDYEAELLAEMREFKKASLANCAAANRHRRSLTDSEAGFQFEREIVQETRLAIECESKALKSAADGVRKFYTSLIAMAKERRIAELVELDAQTVKALRAGHQSRRAESEATN